MPMNVLEPNQSLHPTPKPKIGFGPLRTPCSGAGELKRYVSAENN